MFDIKEDLNCSSPEMLFGMSVRLPGDFFAEDNLPKNPTVFFSKLKCDIHQLKPTPASHHHSGSIFIYTDLLSCSHVFLKVDLNKRPLKQPYTGPHNVVERISDRV